MIRTVNYIESIIYTWCIEDGNYGLTMPNIIGAIRTYTSKKNYSIDDFFNELPKVNVEIKVSFCNDLDEFVFGTFKKEDAPKKYYNEINSISFSKNEIDINNYDELIVVFKERYSDKINNELYSKNYYSKKWSGLSDDDDEFFKKILNKKNAVQQGFLCKAIKVINNF